jgi:vacuolar-type H+-ATPase subunit B/Vma2
MQIRSGCEKMNARQAHADLVAMIGEGAFRDRDRLYLKFADTFERRFIG